MKYKYIIWDWNGTLFNDVQISIDTMNRMLEKKEYPQRIDMKLYKEIFSFPVMDYYKKVGFDFKKHSFDDLAQLFIDMYSQVQNSAELFDDTCDILEYFKRLGVRQSVISVCESERLFYQISHFNVNCYFDDVLGTNDNYAVSKVEIAEKWFNDNNISTEEAVFIGDTVHDFEVAQAVGCDCVLVADGHQSKDILKSTDAAVVDRLDDLKKYLTNF